MLSVNFRRISVLGAVILLSTVLFFCSKNQPPTAPTPAAAKILSFVPTTAHIGDQVIITGENFSADKTADSVFFTRGRLAVIDSATTSKVYVRVPQGTVTGILAVHVGGSVDTSKQVFTLDTLPLPTVINLQPTSGALGTIVTITGTNFDTTQGHTVVTINGVREKIISISPTKIVVEIIGGTSGAITIAMNSDTLTTSTNFTVTKRNETITSFTPTRGKVGTQVTITGTNFNPDTSGLSVTFGTVSAQVVSVTATQIVTVVPAGAITAPISVSLFGEQASSATPFQVVGKYQFDSVYVEVDNLPLNLTVYYDGVVRGSLLKNQSFYSCSYSGFNDTLSHLDTSIYTSYVNTSYIGGSGSMTCTAATSIIFDTAAQMIHSLIVNENHIEYYTNNGASYGNNAIESIIRFSNIPFSGDSIVLLGGNFSSSFRDCKYYEQDSPPPPSGDYSDDSISQVLPFTDSTYIKIVLK